MFRTKFVEKINTRFVVNNPTPPENLIVYKVMWKSMVEPDRRQMMI